MARRPQLLHTDFVVLQAGGGYAHGPTAVARNVPAVEPSQNQGHPVSYLIFTYYRRKIYSTIFFF